jgi:hypothetical protein
MKGVMVEPAEEGGLVENQNPATDSTSIDVIQLVVTIVGETHKRCAFVRLRWENPKWILMFSTMGF